MPGWQVLDLTEYSGNVSIRDHVVFVDGTRVVPVRDLSGVALGPKVTASMAALSVLAGCGVSVSISGHAGPVKATVLGLSGHDRVALRHRAQAGASEPTRKRLWKEIVRAKILAQSHNVQGLARQKLLQMRSQVRSGDATNVEGRAARVYWTAMRGSEEEWRRAPRGRGVINQALDYGYGIIRNHTTAAIFAAGLWPTHGFHHRHRSNSRCLADDLMEPYRPVVDRMVFGQLRHSERLGSEEKRQIASVLEQECIGGEQVRASINLWAQAVGRYLEEPSKDVPTPALAVLGTSDPEGVGDGEPANVGHGDV